ncbi:MAG: hypothetical protein WC443_08330, partial [Desulfobaccales bacterium]
QFQRTNKAPDRALNFLKISRVLGFSTIFIGRENNLKRNSLTTLIIIKNRSKTFKPPSASFGEPGRPTSL